MEKGDTTVSIGIGDKAEVKIDKRKQMAEPL
jgi:hypothetical protein